MIHQLFWLIHILGHYVIVSIAIDTSMTVYNATLNNVKDVKKNDCHSGRSVDIEKNYKIKVSALERAQKLQVPPVTRTTEGDTENLEFWMKHGDLLREAWDELDQENWNQNTFQLDSMVNHLLVEAVTNAWKHSQINKNDEHNLLTDIENHIQSLWDSTDHSDVYSMDSFLTNEGVVWLRRQLEYVKNTGIPLRRPNAMNRYGVIVSSSSHTDFDQKIDGSVQLSSLDQFITSLIDFCIRPLCRLLFPSLVGQNKEDDLEHYAFTISYQPDQDVELKEHRDASLFTMNINLNLQQEEDESFDGSSLYFIDDEKQRRYVKPFSEGMAILHPGSIRHAALPINDGSRHNLIIWIFGKHGDVRVSPYHKKEQMTQKERWSLFSSNAPFTQRIKLN